MTDEEALVSGIQALIRIITREVLGEVGGMLPSREKAAESANVPRAMKEPAFDKELVTVPVLAEYLNVPKSFIWSKTRSGKIPHYKVGKYLRYDLQEVATALRAG